MKVRIKNTFQIDKDFGIILILGSVQFGLKKEITYKCRIKFKDFFFFLYNCANRKFKRK